MSVRHTTLSSRKQSDLCLHCSNINNILVKYLECHLYHTKFLLKCVKCSTLANHVILKICWHGKQPFMNHHESFLLWTINTDRYLRALFWQRNSPENFSGLGLIVTNFSVMSSSVSNHNFIKLLTQTASPLGHGFFPRLLSLWKVAEIDYKTEPYI